MALQQLQFPVSYNFFSRQNTAGFVYGASALPKGRKRGTLAKTFRLTKTLGVAMERLPVSHTCMFQLELPPYKNAKVMRKKLLAAINYGGDAIALS